jgi:hypothetical protein
MNVNKNANNGNIVDSITFDISEAAEAMIAAQAAFGENCSIVGLGDDYFKIVMSGGVDGDTKDIASIGYWWEKEWNEVTE